MILLFEPFDAWFFDALGFVIKDLLAIERAVHVDQPKFFDDKKSIRQIRSHNFCLNTWNFLILWQTPLKIIEHFLKSFARCQQVKQRKRFLIFMR